MAFDIREAHSTLREVCKACDDSRHLRTGDRLVGSEVAVLKALENTGVGQSGDRRARPIVIGNILEVVALLPVILAAFIGEQSEEDGSNLGAGYVVVRADGFVLVAHDVVEVYVLFELGNAFKNTVYIGDVVISGNVFVSSVLYNGIGGNIVALSGAVLLAGDLDGFDLVAVNERSIGVLIAHHDSVNIGL